MADSMPHEYRSATEYPVRVHQTDAVLCITAYRRKDFFQSVIWFSPQDHKSVRHSIATSFRRSASTGLGTLDKLPVELLHDILLRIDMCSILNFRNTNLMSRQISDSLKPYQAVVSHGMNLLCALLRTHLAGSVSLSEFYSALRTKACSFCGEFGGFISLLTWERCCFECVRKAPETQALPLAALRAYFRMTQAEIHTWRSFKTLPGTYTLGGSRYKSSVSIVSGHQARQRLRHARHIAVLAQIAGSARNQKFRSMASCALPYYDRQTGRVEHGISCAGCQSALEKEIFGRGDEERAFRVRNKMYARGDFLNHFHWCAQAQLLWMSSDEGSNLPHDLPELARIGSLFHDEH